MKTKSNLKIKIISVLIALSFVTSIDAGSASSRFYHHFEIIGGVKVLIPTKFVMYYPDISAYIVMSCSEGLVADCSREICTYPWDPEACPCTNDYEIY